MDKPEFDGIRGEARKLFREIVDTQTTRGTEEAVGPLRDDVWAALESELGELTPTQRGQTIWANAVRKYKDREGRVRYILAKEFKRTYGGRQKAKEKATTSNGTETHDIDLGGTGTVSIKGDDVDATITGVVSIKVTRRISK